MLTDEELLQALYDGDSAALETLFQRYERVLGGFLLYCVGDVAIARPVA